MRWMLLAMMLWAGSAQAAEWSAADTALEVSGAALHVADWSQTLAVARAGRERRPALETNPVLGPHPSDAGIHAYFAATLALHAAVAYLLPRPYRAIWQAAWIGVEGACVGQNLSVGMGFALP